MSTFDPWQPAILHDRVEHRIITWTGEHAADYERHGLLTPYGSVEWNGKIFDGWGDVLRG
jgi:hypothetical protein